VFDVTTTRRLPVASAVRVVVDSGPPGRLTRVIPESVTVTGPRRVVNGMSSVSTVDQTVTVHDSGEFLVPLDVKHLAGGVRVRPSEVHVHVELPPRVRAARDSARLTAFRQK
jgi:hypothetical protein